MFRRFLINNYSDVEESLSDFSVSVESYGSKKSSNDITSHSSFWAGIGVGIGISFIVACIVGGILWMFYKKRSKDSSHVKLPDDD